MRFLGVVTAVIAVLSLCGLASAQEDWLDLGADSLRWDSDGRSVTAKGNVRAAHGEFQVHADEMSADLRARTAQFRGNVRLVYRGETFEGESLSVSLATDEWEFQQAKSSISPSFFQSGVLRPVIVSAKGMEGAPSLVSGGPATATTCDLAQPHYRLEAKELRIRPGRDLTARHASLWLGNRRIMSVPSFWVSLRAMRRQGFIPEVGESALEGSYLKTRTGYVMSDRSYGAILLDAMSRRGFGQGIEHLYGAGSGQGDITLYHVRNPSTDLRELSGRLNHTQPLGEGASLGLTANYHHNAAWYSGGSTLASLRGNIEVRRGQGVSTGDFSYSLSQGIARLSQQSAAIRHEQPGLSLSSEWQRNATLPGQADDQELNTRLRIARTYRSADLSLDASRRFDVDRERYAGDDFYQVQDRLPELALTTTSTRLGLDALRNLPSRMSLSVGNFHEEPTSLTALRANLLWEASPPQHDLGKRTSLLVAGGLRQAFYGDKDHTAQYVYRTDATLRHSMGDASLRLSYHLQEPKGFTPFRFDFISPYRFLSAAFEFKRGETKASLLSGFDFENSRWQSLLMRSSAPLSKRLSVTASSAYNLNEGQFRDVVTQAQWKRGDDWLNLGARYDARRGQLRRVAVDADVDLAPRWRLRYLAGYDRALRKVIYNEAMLVRDLHCWEALFFYSQQRKMFRLDFRIKAFEWGRRDFGLGRFGQRVDSTMPEPY